MAGDQARRSDLDRAAAFVSRNQGGEIHQGLVRRAAASLSAAGQEMQVSFDGGVAALIVGCHQFARFRRDGVVEILVPDEAKEFLKGEGVQLQEPEGTVFRLFGWIAVACEAPADALERGLDDAVQMALAKAA